MSGEVLSQNEIDALLSAISTGEMDADELKKEQSEKKVKVYDFKRALRFSKDQVRSLTRIHENFARLLTTFFSAQLRTYVQISVASADQIPYEEFIRSIPKMTILNVFEVPPLDGRILMEVNPNIAYAMMDRMMGGRGSSINKVDTLTEIETKIMSNTFERAFEHLREAWSTITEIDPFLAEFEINPQFLQMVSPNETVVVISLNTMIGETSGMINICIPHVVLEPIIPKLSVHYWMQTEKKEREPEELGRLEDSIQKAQVPVSAELGSADISIQDFLMLDLGDVIELNQAIDRPLTIKIGDIPKFTGQPGKANKKLAIQILDTLKGGDSDDE
ncbi:MULTISPECIES: flagellar motor switch protein FliM [Bacillus]|jgi:flagellar motor switch protein FliM|uniref:Flagellar motor switch protein FliM n=2 Tax=Bacillus infantis TaxID=324767 RepID=U5LB99_9BACI|nr:MULTISPECIES: flagellar motor switch protein FliM [Bacillus]AGX03872.1 flagellar motor switch protein FliM [Bacillus infantis NRRL B-14911]EAR65713.1 flagellar motor switch protein M [Bacillus sp. NRRL B-14911]MCA1034703.1 flagellar motor switch protein FliM [Bacillus infantis]MCP1158064.1 flagellar motor switch protein FliM [Bacillus infantis]MDT0159380.1 flagellar motor switch protein FliM [Bacillus sp. AG4(2022)]